MKSRENPLKLMVFNRLNVCMFLSVKYCQSTAQRSNTICSRVRTFSLKCHTDITRRTGSRSTNPLPRRARDWKRISRSSPTSSTSCATMLRIIRDSSRESSVKWAPLLFHNTSTRLITSPSAGSSMRSLNPANGYYYEKNVYCKRRSCTVKWRMRGASHSMLTPRVISLRRS